MERASVILWFVISIAMTVSFWVVPVIVVVLWFLFSIPLLHKWLYWWYEKR